ncbi:MAG: phosphate/phosphite/phosphonate ABC transporter substrate-binding protein [Phycisphaerales bacterium]
MLFWLGHNPQELSALDNGRVPNGSNTTTSGALYLGLIPERDIFDQRRRYRALADYFSHELGRPVTLVTSNTYHGALKDMAEGRIDAAFMGSLVATLAIDQLQARVLVKPEDINGETTYHGVIFVRDDSPITRLDEMAGRSIAMVKTTTAGHLFPIYALVELDLFADQNPVKIRWDGTHDRVIQDVFDGEVDAGAAKNLRIDAFEQAHMGYRFRRLAAGEAVPNNALIVRPDVDSELVGRIEKVLLGMHENEAGKQALDIFGAARFVPCVPEEYRPIYAMTERLGPGWCRIGSSESETPEPEPEPAICDKDKQAEQESEQTGENVAPKGP